MSKRFALLVGMTAYPDDRLAATATNMEMRTLVERLRDPENGRFDRVVPLLNQTAVELQLGIASFFEQETTPDDLILFYFAGHSLIHHQNIYLATTDTFTEEYLDATTVEIDFVRRRLNASPAQQVVLLDCDFSLMGATDRHIDGFEMVAKAFRAENRAVIAAAALTGAVVEGLEGAADTDHDGAITFVELGAYVQAHRTEEEPITIVAHEKLDGLPLAFCESGATAVPPIPPPVTPTADTASPPSKRGRYGLIALLLLLLLTAFGYYAVSSGLFAGDGEVANSSEPAPTKTVAAVVPEVSEIPSATPTSQAKETAVATATKTATPTKTDTPEATETRSATKTATPTSTAPASATQKPTATAKPSATPSATPTAQSTSDSVPMDVVAQQAFLRAGPDINYRILDFLAQGTAVTVIARNNSSTWYNVILEDGSRGWLHVDVLATDDEDAFDGIPVAATIPVPQDDFYDPELTYAGDSLTVQVGHTYVGTQGDIARFQARLLPETDLVQPTYPSGQALGLGLLTVVFNRVADGEYSSEQVELCMVSDTGTPFYCETVFARKSW
ncbi:MAG: SH3 domain-containing protein [Anaerolineae bacterium]|nr:SH3 domain-containing protein [Anaerolineae bacterium]